MGLIKQYFIIIFALLSLFPLSAYAFDRQAAVSYADKYFGPTEGDYNANFINHNVDGGDCANFVSQCLIAGNIAFNWATGWVDAKGAMPNAKELGEELLANHGVITTIDYDNDDFPLPILTSADPVFLMRIFSGWPDWGLLSKTHAMIIVGRDTHPDYPGRLLLTYNAHNNERYHWPFEKVDEWSLWPDPDVPLEYPFKFLRYFHISTAPIIKYFLLTQNGQTINKYRYDDDYDETLTSGEYYANTYNGIAPLIENPNVAVSGELHLKIIFDTSMQTNISISCGLNQPYEDYTFSTIQWTQTHQTSDTWEGKLTIPTTAASGDYTIKVNGYALDGSQIDSSGHLATYNPGPDTLHHKNIDRIPFPTVLIS